MKSHVHQKFFIKDLFFSLRSYKTSFLNNYIFYTTINNIYNSQKTIHDNKYIIIIRFPNKVRKRFIFSIHNQALYPSFLFWMKIVVIHLYKSKERKMAKKPLEKLLSFPTRNRTRDLQDASRALYPPRHQHLPLIFRYTSLFHLAYIYISYFPWKIFISRKWMHVIKTPRRCLRSPLASSYFFISTIKHDALFAHGISNSYHRQLLLCLEIIQPIYLR